MPIDTSSYYPEVPGSGLSEEGESLNSPHRELFGGTSTPPQPKPKEEESNEQKSNQPSADSQSPQQPEPLPSLWESFTDGFATLISWAFVPMMMPVYGIMLIFGLSILDIASFSTRLSFTLVVAAFNVLIPMILVILLKKMGIVHDVGLNERKERFIPYLIVIVCMLGTAVFMWYKHAPMWVSMFFAGGAAAGLVNLTINFWWKISAHAAGIAGIVALLIRIIKDGYPEPASMTWLLIAIGLSGLLGSARIWLGRHTVWQVLCGYAVGFCAVFFLTMIR